MPSIYLQLLLWHLFLYRYMNPFSLVYPLGYWLYSSSPLSFCTLSYNVENFWTGEKPPIVLFGEACSTAHTTAVKVLSPSSHKTRPTWRSFVICQSKSCRWDGGMCSYTPGLMVTVLMHPFDASLSYSIELPSLPKWATTLSWLMANALSSLLAVVHKHLKIWRAVWESD